MTLLELEAKLKIVSQHCRDSSGHGERYDFWKRQRKRLLQQIEQIRPLTPSEVIDVASTGIELLNRDQEAQS